MRQKAGEEPGNEAMSMINTSTAGYLPVSLLGLPASLTTTNLINNSIVESYGSIIYD